MTDKPNTNPLTTRSAGALQVQPEGYWRERLQTHCDTLNRYEWIRASGRLYIVQPDKNGRLAVTRQGEMPDADAR